MEEVNEDDPLGIIGKKITGFEFPNEHPEYKNLSYNDDEMNEFLGEEGEIVGYSSTFDCYTVKFINAKEEELWSYPSKLIKFHLIVPIDPEVIVINTLRTFFNKKKSILKKRIK